MLDASIQHLSNIYPTHAISSTKYWEHVGICVIRTEIFGDIKHSFLEFYSIWRKWGVSFYRISESLSFKSHSIMANYFWNWSIGTWKEWRKIMLVLMKDKLTNWWFFHLNWFCMILIPVSSTPLAIIEC